MAEKIVRAHVLIKGKVQGVFYRVWTFKQAQSLGLAGWVKNLKDKKVEAVFEGPKEKVEEMIEKCKEGPRPSNVKHLKVSWEKASGEFSSFEILR